MELLEKISADLKAAMLGGNKLATNTLRMLKSELKNAEITQGSPLDEATILQIIKKEAKKRSEAIEGFTKAGHSEQAEQEKQEAELLQAYLPAQIDREVVKAFVQELVQNASTPLNKGEIIKATLTHFNGQTDGKTVSELATEALA